MRRNQGSQENAAASNPAAQEGADEAQAVVRVGDWELDVATGRIQGSRTWYDIWGFNPDEDITLDVVLRHIPPKDREQTAKALQRASEAGTPFRLRHRIMRPDGSLRWAESAGRLDPACPASTRTMSGFLLDITQRREAEQTLARYVDILSALPDRLAFLDRKCCLQAANPAFMQALGRTPEQAVGRPFHAICGPGALSDLVYRHLGRCLEDGQPVVDDIQEADPDGEDLESEVKLLPSRDDQGTIKGIVVYVRDVTRARESERRLRQAAAVYAATSDGVLITDASWRIVAANDAFTRITGYSEAELLGRKPTLLNSQWHSRGFFSSMLRVLRDKGSWQGEIWNRRKDGEIALQKLTVHRLPDARGKVMSFVGVFAERAAAGTGLQRAEYVAHYDPLTKLPNRILFQSRVAHAIDPGRRNRIPAALFLCDIDRFAHINASLGHQIGDEILRAVGLRLRETIRPADTLARLSGNQFGLLFEGVRDPAEAEEIARRLRAALRMPISLRGHELFVTVSMGIALDAGAGSDSEIMIANAESALHLAKHGGRDGFRIHAGQPGDPATERQHLIGLLRDALRKGELQLRFRPRVNLDTGRLVGAEALVHWHQPRLGNIPPERFLPLADAGGMRVDIGQWVLGEACRQFKEWLVRGLQVPTLSVSISEPELTRIDLVPGVARLLRTTGLDPKHLELELGESLLFKHREQAREAFNGLHRLGVRLTLSEVGTSWLAPAVLRRLPVNRLKIHRAFVEAMTDSDDDLAVVQALISMAQALDLDIVADGVRNDQQRLTLLNMGCQQAQGDLFAPLLSPPQLERCFVPTIELQSSDPVED
ncbi:MAG: EAL domain-containing protein [Thiocapsa sp.]|nr:EAL domain-containing protein [Thiocapsa sp.]MCG6985465.1 EAL domain-containing protein [Thiocapsa sp.]